MQEAEGWLRQCEVLVDRLGLFSPNEEVEDIATGDLKYLLVSQQHAEVVARMAGREPHARRRGLMRALESYTRCDTPTAPQAHLGLAVPTVVLRLYLARRRYGGAVVENLEGICARSTKCQPSAAVIFLITWHA